ncbi:MAG: endonuclease MutS2, partial [Clostridia bacterium]|nr:endonuclease MutS2 [Clostridia bacterium]
MADAASSDLADIRRHIRGCTARVREHLDKMIRSPSYQKLLQEQIVTIRSGRFVVPVKAEFRSDVPGLVHDTSSSGATVFIEPMGVVEANNELKVLFSKEQNEIARILSELSAEVGEFAESIAAGYKTAVTLDFVFARARLAFDMKAFAPAISESGGVVLNKARHPLLDPKSAVPVTISLGGSFDTLVITGPNTGGKTVALKTLGLLVLMTMSGLMIPADETSSVGFFTQVLADIGDEQSIEQSLSTFSAHMVNIVDIIAHSDAQSLVLLDELGSGTDPVEGAALAVAVLESLRSTGALLAATTHYSELKVYALQTNGVENACCEFDIATLRPTFRLLIGVPGRSNAFAISERLGLPPDIIERAKALVSSDDSRFEDVVQSLEAGRQILEQQTREAELLRAEALREKQASERMRIELEKEREKELEKARITARRLLEQSRAQAQQLFDEIDELKKKESAGELSTLREQAKAQLNARLRSLEKVADPVHRPAPAYRLPRALRAGDSVIIEGINKQGSVLTPPDGSGYLDVQAGIIRTRLHVSELRLLDEKPALPTGYTQMKLGRAKGAVKTELDLRGQNAEEGLLEL